MGKESEKEYIYSATFELNIDFYLDQNIYILFQILFPCRLVQNIE